MDPTETYKQMMSDMAAGLASDEFWCVANDEGLFEATASKDMGECVRTFCETFDLDWDEAKEAGCRLAIAKKQAAPLNE